MPSKRQTFGTVLILRNTWKGVEQREGKAW